MHRVLLADGDQDSRDLMAQALSLDDYQIEAVSLGGDALRHIAEGTVDILITEVHLPDMPAWDLIPRVHRIDPDIPVITVTADDTWETSRRVRMAADQAIFYGLKPLDLREMQEVVRSVVRWRQERLRPRMPGCTRKAR